MNYCILGTFGTVLLRQQSDKHCFEIAVSSPLSGFPGLRRESSRYCSNGCKFIMRFLTFMFSITYLIFLEQHQFDPSRRRRVRVIFKVLGARFSSEHQILRTKVAQGRR